MKLFEHEELERTPEQLPELPHDVEVPDDISSIRHPTTPRPTGVRWIRWLAAAVVIGVVGVVGAMLLFGGETEDALTMDPMEQYGTDNPVIVDPDAVPGSVVVGGDYMDLYGTDNPVIVDQGAVPVEVGGTDYMDLYGTDNPVIVEDGATPGVVDSMDLYGTDNPVFVDRTPMERYGTDNPAFVGD